MVYQIRGEGLKVSSGYEMIDPERPLVFQLLFRQEASIKFLRPDEVDWRAKRDSNPMTTGYPVDPNTVPRMARWCRDRFDRKLDVDLCCGTLLISKRVCDVIERFEPGVHQFLPVDVYLSPYKIGDIPVTRSFFLVVGQVFDAVNTELTKHPRSVIKHPDGRESPGVWFFEGDSPVIFEREKIAGRHLWIDPNITPTEHPFMSDLLGQELLSMELYGAIFEHFDEV